MKWHKTLRTFGGSLLFSSLLGGMTYAQDANSDADEDLYELSPFVVETQDDDGYLASTTLAGSRIRSNVKDLGTSLAIITEDFMDDMGGTDGESILGLVANVEVGGVLGNFANVDESNDNSTQGARLNPQGNQRIRGLSSAKTTRDYFDTLLPFDSYNTSRVSVNRGPNSILFGLGSPGGVINNSTNLALLNVNSGQVSFRLDAQGGHRETVNINRSIIEDRLALRIAAMNEHVKFQQDPAYEKDTRTYFAIDSVLLKNEKSRFLGKTKFRASYEDVYIDRNPPDVVPPSNSYQSYFEGFGSTEDLLRALSVPGTDLTDIGNNALTQEQVIAAVNAGLATVPDGMTLDEYAAIEGQFIPGTLVNRFARSNTSESGRPHVPSTTRYWIFPILNYNTTTTQSPGFDDPALAGIAGIMGRWRPNFTQDHAWSAPATAGSGFLTKSIMDRDVFDYQQKQKLKKKSRKLHLKFRRE